MLTEAQQRQWEDDGFIIFRGFAEAGVGETMLAEVTRISREGGGQLFFDGKVVTPEANLRPGGDDDDRADGDTPAEQLVSKIFRLHRDPVFADFVRSDEVLAIVRQLLGPDLDCFLSQFIFKNPGAWGQPWHQDEHYFPFDRHPQVGLWLAVTEATLENGCLHVVPGSHKEPVHEHVTDRRPDANFGYVEIVDHDMSSSIAVTMQPGDLLVFHSRLMHRSTDNESDGLRAAMVYHLAEHGTVDHHPDSPVNDWAHLPLPPVVDATSVSS